MGDRYHYDKDGRYTGRSSDKPPSEDVDLSGLGPAIGLAIFLCIAYFVLVLVVLSPGLLFNRAVGRFTDARNLGDFLQACQHDGLTWTISVSVWACIVFACYKSKKFFKAFIYVCTGATVGWVVGFFIGLNIFGSYSSENWGTWSVDHDKMGKLVDSSCIPAAFAGALLGFALFSFIQAVAAKKPNK